MLIQLNGVNPSHKNEHKRNKIYEQTEKVDGRKVWTKIKSSWRSNNTFINHIFFLLIFKRKLSDASIDSDDDLVKLNSCGIKSHFRFPKHRRRCLNVRCAASFKTRAEAIQHYKAAHSETAIYCEPCKKPVHTTNPAYWQAHCESRHPQMNSKSNADAKSIGTSSTVSKSPESKHSSKSSTKIICPLKECSFKSRRMHKLRKHWNKEHSDLRFPLVHEKHHVDDQQLASSSNRTKQTKEVREINY